MVYIQGSPILTAAMMSGQVPLSFLGGAAIVASAMLYLLSRTGSELPKTNPEGFVEARFINEVESAGFFEEMNRQYGK